MGAMTFEHVIYIPLMLLLGLAIGFTIGSRSVHAEYQRKRERLKD